MCNYNVLRGDDPRMRAASLKLYPIIIRIS